MVDNIEAEPYRSKGGRIHKGIISLTSRNVFLDFEYPEKTEPPKELVKFYQVNENNVNALLKGYLWAAHPSTFNDPFDCPAQIWNLDSFTKANMLQLVEEPFWPFFNDDNISNRSNFIHFQMGFTGIICLNNYSLINEDVLWGYYTNQQGYSILFDNNQLMKGWNSPFGIEYIQESELSHFSLNEITKGEDLFPLVLRWCTQKKKIWENETEWRYIFHDCIMDPLNLKSKQHPSREKTYSPNAIKEINLGYRFFEESYGIPINNDSMIYITDSCKHILQNRILSHLAFPSQISVKHMFMKDDLILYTRACKIYKEDERRFRVDYLE